MYRDARSYDRIRMLHVHVTLMRRHYLHVRAYPCDECKGPVISASMAVRETEISKETEARQLGAICLSCGHKQAPATGAANIRDFPPVQWDAEASERTDNRVSAYVEESNREELH